MYNGDKKEVEIANDKFIIKSNGEAVTNIATNFHINTSR